MAVFLSQYTARNRLFFYSFGVWCNFSAQTQSCPNLCLDKYTCFLNYFRFGCSSLDQSHSLSNTSTWPTLAALCQAVFPELSLDNHNSFLNSSGFSCRFLAQSHNFSNILTWPLFAVICQVVCPNTSFE